MADRNLVYRVQINTSQAKGEAKQFAAQIKAELSNIKIAALDSRMFAGADKQIAKIRTELQSLSQIQAPKVAVDTSGLQQAAQQADNLEKQLREAETQAKRTSAATKAVQPPRTTTPGAGGGAAGNGALGLATGALGAVGISLSAAAILQGAVALDDLRAKTIRAEAALTALAGSGTKARDILRSIEQASKGTVTELQAQEIAVQGLALNLAKTPAEFEKLVKAAKQITIGSATIKDIGTALTELSLFAANEKSFARADQLAVSASEVKDRMAELQAQDDSLTDSQAKLLATMGALDAKFGSVTDSAAANASGIEKLRVAFSDLFSELATGPVGTGVDAVFGAIADGVNNLNSTTKVTKANWKIILGVDDLQDNVTRIEALLTEANLATGLERLQRGIFGDDLDAPALGQFLNTVKLFNQAIDEGASDVEGYRAALDAIADDAADGSLTEGNIAALQNLDTVLIQEIQRLRELKTAQEETAGPDVQEIADAQRALNDAIGAKAVEVVGAIGSAKANELVKQQLEKVKQTIADFEAQGLKGVELEVAIKLAEGSLTDIFDSVAAASEQLKGSNIATTLSAELTRGLVESNNAAFDGSAALAGYREELANLSLEITNNGTASEEQATRVRELVSIFDGATSSSGVYAALQNEVGQALLTSNTYASELATQTAILDGALASGKITAEQHAGAMYILVGALIAAAEAAGITGSALANLKAIQAGFAPTGTPGNVAGQNTGDAIVAAQAALEAARQREEQRRASEKAAREQEQAAKRAAKDLEQGAKKARRDLEQALQGVEGLFGTSKVTQKDLDFAAAGGEVNFADDFVRHFRDLVENGVPWEDATPEKVKQALSNVGIDPVDDLKGLMIQLEEAWNNSSLFSNKDNLSLINADAVQQGLDLQEKMKQGRQNIMEFFGVAIDDATGAVTSVEADPTGGEELKTAVSDGKQKIIDHLTGATNDAVSAATASVVTGANGGTVGTKVTGAAQISAVTIAPQALAGLFDGITPPSIEITTVTIQAGVGSSIAVELAAEISKQSDLLYGIGGGIASLIQLGIESQDFSPSGITIVGEISTGIASPANLERLLGMGGGIAGFIQLGLDEFDFAPSGTAITDDISAGLTTPEAIAALNNTGGGAASQVRIGFDAYSFASSGLAILDDLSQGLSAPESTDRMYGIGGGIAGFIQLGLDGYDFSTSGIAVLEDLATGLTLPQATLRMYGIGGGIASFIQLGFESYDFGIVGSSLVDSITGGLTTDTSIEQLTTAGHGVADALYNGFAARIPEADWVGVIVAAVIAQLNAGVQQTQ